MIQFDGIKNWPNNQPNSCIGNMLRKHNTSGKCSSQSDDAGISLVSHSGDGLHRLIASSETLLRMEECPVNLNSHS